MSKQQEILAVWRLRKTLKETARDVGVSTDVVRKTLITAGLWTSPTVERIRSLTAGGMPVKDIAALLNLSPGAVSAHMPYTKGSYLNPQKSINAMRIKKSRNKKLIGNQNF